MASEKEPIFIETEATKDAMWTNPQSLAERDYESPMPVLDSVAEVSLTPEEEERAIDEARDKEKYTKSPREPKHLRRKNNSRCDSQYAQETSNDKTLLASTVGM